MCTVARFNFNQPAWNEAMNGVRANCWGPPTREFAGRTISAASGRVGVLLASMSMPFSAVSGTRAFLAKRIEAPVGKWSFAPSGSGISTSSVIFVWPDASVSVFKPVGDKSISPAGSSSVGPPSTRKRSPKGSVTFWSLGRVSSPATLRNQTLLRLKRKAMRSLFPEVPSVTSVAI